MLSHPLAPKLKKLRLSGILDTLEIRADASVGKNISPIEFFSLLIDDEIERREQKKIEKLKWEAGFEDIKLLSQFEFNANPGIDRNLIMEMATCRFITAKENWIICGPTGVGKSHLAKAIGYEAIKRGIKVKHWTAHKLLSELMAARSDSSYRKVLNKLIKVDLLILDDFGLKPMTGYGAEDMYEIIYHRYEKGSIILTSNRNPTEWGELFEDDLMASAALDRLTHHARITKISGDSYRQKHRLSGTIGS